QSLIGELKNDESAVSMRLNSGKNALLENPHVLNFMTGAVVILFNAIKEDLLKENSGIAMNMRAAIELVGKNLAESKEVRQ
ncbi:hypothetical protein ABFV54_28240, partial [Pseudomonas syringae]